MDDLRYQLESEPEQNRHIIRSLTDVTNKTRDTLNLRVHRANELKDYLARNLARLNDLNHLDYKDDVSAECERQLESINSLKSLYNERLRVLNELKDAAFKELAEVKESLKSSSKDREVLEEDLRKAEEKVIVFGSSFFFFVGSHDKIRFTRTSDDHYLSLITFLDDHRIDRLARYGDLESGVSIGFDQGRLQRSTESNVLDQQFVHSNVTWSFLGGHGSRQIVAVITGRIDRSLKVR